MKKYIIVNSVTALSLTFGLVAIFFAVYGYLYLSFALALLAFALDFLDGYLARMLGAESRFGAIFDTVSDIIVYLFYPAVILLNNLKINSPIGIFFVVIFLIAGIFRLIRFTKDSFFIEAGKKYYLGMPVFFSHLLLIILIILNFFGKNILQITGPLLLGFMSFMMITKYKFRKP